LALSIWAGVAYYKSERRAAREAKLKAEHAMQQEAMRAARIDLRDPEEVATEKARRDKAARREAERRATADSQAKIDEIKRERAMRFALAGARALEQAMKDPDSFVMRSARMYSSGATCYQYRSKNSFSGYVLGRALIEPDGNLRAEEASDAGFGVQWAAWCPADRGTEVVQTLRDSGAN